MAINIYLGAPLFSEQELRFNSYVKDLLEDALVGYDVNIYAPQENLDINDKSNFADSLAIYKGDNDHLKDTDILVALLDGQTADIGLASEIGYYASLIENTDKEGTIIGLYSDTRQGNVTEDKTDALSRIAESQWSYINLYTVGAVKSNGEIVSSSDKLVKKVVTAVRLIEGEI